MNARESLIRLATVVTALAELKREGIDGIPDSSIYSTVCRMQYSDWVELQATLLGAGLITCTAHFVRITEKGITTAQEIERAMTLNRRKDS